MSKILDLKEKVEGVVYDFIDQDYMFSAFDVTKKIRDGGEIVPHWRVREIVNNMFNKGETGDYTRTLMSINGKSDLKTFRKIYGDGCPGVPSYFGANDKVTCFIYHTKFSDASDYKEDWLEKAGLINLDKKDDSSKDLVLVPKSKLVENVKISLTSSEKRLNIPHEMFEIINVSPYEDVFVFEAVLEKQKVLAICGKGNKFLCEFDVHYQTDSYGRIRISKSVVEGLLGSSSSEDFLMSVIETDNGNAICVKRI